MIRKDSMTFHALPEDPLLYSSPALLVSDKAPFLISSPFLLSAVIMVPPNYQCITVGIVN